jgi:hypothetical protein
VQIGPLVTLLEEQDEAMRVLFAKALNLYVSPRAGRPFSTGLVPFNAATGHEIICNHTPVTTI